MVPRVRGELAATEGQTRPVGVVHELALEPDPDAVFARLHKTKVRQRNRRTERDGVVVQEAPRVAGYGAELAAILAEKAILDLRGPVLRVTGYDVPYPYWQIEDAYMPSVDRVSAAVRKLLEF